MAEVALTIVPLVLSVLRSVEVVTHLFGRSQNAPRQVQQLKLLLFKVSKDLNGFQNCVSPGGQNCIIPADAQEEISRALVGCRAILDKYSSSVTKTRALSGIRQAVWQMTNGVELDRYQDQIRDFYIFFIIPGLFRTGRRDSVDMSASGEPEPPARGANFHSEPSPKSIGLPHCLQVQIGSFGPSGIPRRSHKAETAAEPAGRRATQTLNLLPQESTISPSTKIEHILPCAKTAAKEAVFSKIGDAELHIGDEHTLKLEAVEIMPLDGEATVLHFRCRGSAMTVHHVVSLEDHPFVAGKASLEVKFLNSPTITVRSLDGSRTIEVDQPRYTFARLAARQNFQSLVRGRELVDEFEASDIIEFQGSSKRCLAIWQVLQLWSWTRCDQHRPTFTMTFLSTPGGRLSFYHVECHLEDYIVSIPIARGVHGKVIELLWSQNPAADSRGYLLTFQDKKEAARFRKLLEGFKSVLHGNGDAGGGSGSIF